MEFWDWIWVGVISTVVGGIILAVILRSAHGACVRHRKPSELVEAGKAARVRHRSQAQADDHADLVGQVLLRAEVLQLRPPEDLPVHTTPGPGYVTVTYHPTRRTFTLYPDHPSYIAAGKRGEHIGSNAHYGAPPVVVSKWSDTDLRTWLRKYKDREPPAKDQA